VNVSTDRRGQILTERLRFNSLSVDETQDSICEKFGRDARRWSVRKHPVKPVVDCWPEVELTSVSARRKPQRETSVDGQLGLPSSLTGGVALARSGCTTGTMRATRTTRTIAANEQRDDIN